MIEKPHNKLESECAGISIDSKRAWNVNVVGKYAFVYFK